MQAPAQRTFLAAEGDVVLWTPPPAGVGAYHDLAPSAALRPYVARIHVGCEPVPAGTAIEERILPDGAVHLLFNLGTPPALLGADGTGGAAPGAAAEAVGASTAPAVIRMSGVMEQVGVRLRPGGIAALLGAPAGEVEGRSVPLEVLWGDAASTLHERLAAARSIAARVAVLEASLLDRLARARVVAHPAMPAALRLVHARGGRLRVAELANALGVGERRLGQLFHAHVGVSPKAACRLARFHASVRLLRQEPARTLAQIAHACGYADQAHLTHDVRALAGLTPGALRARLDCGFPQDGATAAR